MPGNGKSVAGEFNSNSKFNMRKISKDITLAIRILPTMDQYRCSTRVFEYYNKETERKYSDRQILVIYYNRIWDSLR